jgi:hypothetical protein
MESSYANACREYNQKIEGDDNNNVTNNEIAELLSKINEKFDNQADQDCNEIDYILKTLYKKSELSAYYKLAKEYKFEFKEVIYDWVKQLILLIHNIK